MNFEFQLLSESQKEDEKEGKKVDEVHKRPERELFVKYSDWSYWDCEWIPELQLKVHQNITYLYFKKKFDMNEPPALEDGSSFGKKRHKGESKFMYSSLRSEICRTLKIQVGCTHARTNKNHRNAFL